MESGKFIHLSEIFSTNNKIIIPDLQRDYCWGTVNNLALNFTKSLIDASGKKVSQFSLGLLYAYQYPTLYYYLCDGQQRVTTLYLIMGVLNAYEKDRELERIINLSKDEPRLRYEVRNSTVYFLKQLLQEVFNEQNTADLEDLKAQNWWRTEYDTDPSIKSLCKALDDINALLKKDKEIRERLKLFIKKALGFVFFDLKAKDTQLNSIQVREYGEKMYEIVNTRGVPMEPNEHLKPNLLSREWLSEKEKEDWTETWEQWQDFFWKKRGTNETADYGFNEFLRWISIIELSVGNQEDEESEQAMGTSAIKALFKSDKINFAFKGPELIRDYFEALEWIVSGKFTYFKESWLAPTRVEVEKAGVKRHILALSQIEYFTLLPALYYVKCIGAKNVEELTFKRLLRFLDNLKKDETISKVPDVYSISALKAIRALLDAGFRDVVDLLEVAKETLISKTILNKDEVYKLMLYKKAPEATREAYEEAIWALEDLGICYGKVSFVLDCMGVDIEDLSLQTFSLPTFSNYLSLLKNLFLKPTNKLRLALLTKGDFLLYNGTTPSLGGSRYSFINSDDEWRTLIKDVRKRGFLKALINDVIKHDDYEYALSKMIQDYLQTADTSTWEYLFIKDETLLGWCRDRMVCFVENGNGTDVIYLLKNWKVTGADSYKMLATI